MQIEQFVAIEADKHVAKSLAEMRDPAQVNRWSNGERAAEQAEEILTQLLAEAQQVLEQRSTDNAN